MKDTTRRDLLTKLGAGAAFAAASAVAGKAAAYDPAVARAGTVRYTVPSLTRARVALPVELPTRNPGDKILFRLVGTDKGLALADSAKVEDFPVLGRSNDGTDLYLGVTLKGNGAFEINGLDDLINPGGLVSAEGRCHANGLAASGVSNDPRPWDRPVLQRLRIDQKIRF